MQRKTEKTKRKEKRNATFGQLLSSPTHTTPRPLKASTPRLSTSPLRRNLSPACPILGPPVNRHSLPALLRPCSADKRAVSASGLG
ncbi:hypothetical protein E2C01_050859 [Portunus trituberculatus]|uniref:Uncharacterized protein n=1 Tax=Portunus trituberculatus TaxID=210409 RepID=A0A5B7GHL2_PORTR|nr:hypothetical protein [Portunus trituberculatus]